MKTFQTTLALLTLLLSGSLLVAAGPYPDPLFNRDQIRVAKPTLDSINIQNLPLEDYPLLSKFSGLKQIWLSRGEGTLATDEKLEALATLNFTNLTHVNLNNSRLITNRGIKALSKIQSLKQLMLKGTAITDEACDVMASQMSLTAVQVDNCPAITKKGLEVLARSKTLDYFGFSSDRLTQEEVLALANSFNNITWYEIIDGQRKLDRDAIKALSTKTDIHVMEIVWVDPTGAPGLKQLKP